MLATRPHRLAVLASGHGSNFEALTPALQRREPGGRVVLLLCDLPDAHVLVRAERLGVPGVCPSAERTVYLVDAGLEAGPIVGQEAVEFRDGDTLETLERRIHEAEHRLYPETVRRFLGEPWQGEGRRIVFPGRRAEPARG